ncbi:MAG: glycosyltransferase [Ideonella sp.]|nr:glycosyltransferase [Ideonella sp.]MCC7456894.1 glycosyltransferase [Nitrospira sp.]
MPKVSVCVITYNQQRYIRECIQSLVDQKTDFEFEVIVGDDFSTDSTAEIVREFVEHHPGIVRLMVQPNNSGGTRNYLEVHAAATGTYVAHVDGDDYALPGKLQAQVDVLDQDPWCNAVWHRVDYFDDQGHFCSGQTADLASFESGLVTFSDAIRLGFLSVHSSLMYRRSARTAVPVDRRVLDMYLTWDLLSKGHGRILDSVLGRYRVAATGSLTLASQRQVRLLAIEHADEFLKKHPEHRRDFLIWALCRALIDGRNLQGTALNFLGLARRSWSSVRWRDLSSNLQRMRATQVQWRQAQSPVRAP